MSCMFKVSHAREAIKFLQQTTNINIYFCIYNINSLICIITFIQTCIIILSDTINFRVSLDSVRGLEFVDG
jgi:hypothetical protein